MKPKAAPARFPYVEHRTMAEVLRDERKRRDEMSLRRVNKGRVRRWVNV